MKVGLHRRVVGVFGHLRGVACGVRCWSLAGGGVDLADGHCERLYQNVSGRNLSRLSVMLTMLRLSMETARALCIVCSLTGITIGRGFPRCERGDGENKTLGVVVESKSSL